MESILFKNALIIRSKNEVPHFGDLFAKDGVVAELTGSEKADRVIDCTGRILMPALHNTHSHSSMALMRGVGSDLPLQSWLFDTIFPIEDRLTPDIVRTGTQLAMLEMLRFGTVSFADTYFHMDIICQSVLESKMRAMVGWGNSPENQERIIREYGSESKLLNVGTSVHAEYTSSMEYIRSVCQVAHKYKKPMQVHISETLSETENCIKKYGKTPAKLFLDEGAFDFGGIAAHCVYLNDEDAQEFKEKKVYISNCPISNLKLASGILPLKKHLDLGSLVALGTDGDASNNTLNLFEEMRLTALLHKGVLHDAQAVSSNQVFDMATRAGAMANGFYNCGTLDIGMDADIILLDINNVHSYPMPDPIAHVIYSAQGSDVVLTMAAGRILYENGEYLTLDKEKIMAEAKLASQKLGVIK
ncbi:MAG: amidohydrolase [Clostridiales bacterium]|nr:amidohydrolase [Clostridiales bacterium]